MKSKLWLFSLALLLFSLAVNIPLVYADSTSKPPQAGLTVTPAQLSFIVQADTPNKSAELQLTNSYTSPLHLTAVPQGIDEQAARLVPSGSVEQQIGNAVKISATDIVVPAMSTYTLSVSVDGTQLSDGGHYATLVLTQRSDGGSASGFQSAVAVNLFIIKNEHIRTDLELVGMTFDNPLLSLPKSASIVLRNKGNTHVIPRASIIVYDGDDIVSKAVVNSSSTLLLPGDEQRFAVKLDTLKRFWLPRKLTARTMYRIDGSDIQLVKIQTLWHVPLVDSVGLIALLYLVWYWRRSIRRRYAKLHEMTRRYFYMLKHKKKTVSMHGKDAKITEKVINIHVPKAGDMSLPQAQNGFVADHAEVSMSELAKPFVSAKRIVVTHMEDTGVQSSKASPKKRESAIKKQSSTKTKPQIKPRAKKTTKASKKSPIKTQKKKSA